MPDKEKKRVRNKSTGRNYEKEYQSYQGSPEQIAKRSQRNKARRKMEKAGKVHKGDQKDIDHVKPISKGGGNGAGNLRVMDKEKNRSFKRKKDGSMK